MRLTLIVFFLFSFKVFALIDFSSFDITESQLKILRKIEKKGSRSNEWLLNFAGAMERNNQRQRNQRDIYIPPYTPELLDQVSAWARGAAFSSFAKAAGFEFDNKSYREDCPNWAVFNFNRAHGGVHMGRSLSDSALSQSHFLQAHLSKDPEGFSELFWKEAQALGFDQYLRRL